MHLSRLRQSAWAIVACAALTACGVPDNRPVQNLDQFARAYLDSIQAQSISANREFCGYFVRQGTSFAARPSPAGSEAGCRFGPSPFFVVGRYHTHGSYSPDFANEVPSGLDFRISANATFDDYISTPGGRVWKLVGGSGVATQICGLGCVTTDPNFVPTQESLVPQTLTAERLHAILPS